MNLYEKLSRYAETDMYPFHMPGHKRNEMLMKEIYGEIPQDPFRIDITEIDGFDDLHHADGVLKEAMDETAGLTGADRSFFVVNGSTGGILAAIAAACPEGSRIAAARNCHRSVYHAIRLLHLDPVYIYPHIGDKLGISMGISCAEAEDILNAYGDISAVVVTSPTYEGIVSDIKKLAEIVHRHKALLIVDEAHGAHLPFGKTAGFPVSAVQCGADLVIQSLHKTLPALTQSAVLHVCGKNADVDKVKYALRIFETSSPSYVMMAGMDACMRYMGDKGKKRLEWLSDELREFYKESEKWEELCFLRQEELSGKEDAADFDFSKIVFGAAGFWHAGPLLYRWLREDYHLQPEMAAPDYVILMTTTGDTKEGFERLKAALNEINGRLKELTKEERVCLQDRKILPAFEEEKRRLSFKAEVVLRPAEAEKREKKWKDLACCEGEISGEMAYIYPPGIPFLMPGERIGREQIRLISECRSCGFEIRGMKDPTGEKIRVLEETETES